MADASKMREHMGVIDSIGKTRPVNDVSALQKAS